MVSVDLKLSTIEERRQDQSCLSRRADYRNKGRNPEETVLGSIPGQDGFSISETKDNRRMTQRTKLFVSTRRLQELRSQTRKLSWIRVSVNMLDLGIIIMIISFFYDIQRYASNDQACGKLSGNKD
jgi:hypothetical protein